MSIRSLSRRTALALALLVAPLTAQAQAVTKTAVWWNPSESGWGLFTFDQGSAVVPVWYSYDADGEPTWFLVPSAAQADGSYAGDVLKFSGVPLAQIAGQAADPHAVYGRATTRFEGDKRLVFTYTVGGQTQSKTLTRFDFGGNRDLVCRASASASRASASNYSDIWWNPASSGWGLNFQHLGDQLFLTWYTYDTDGEAIFYNGSTTRQTDGSFRGELRRVRNGTPLLQIAGTPATPGSDVIGTVALRFADGENASFDYSIGGVSQSKAITRMRFGDVANTCSIEPYQAAQVQAGECIPEYAVGDLHEYAVSSNGTAATRLEAIERSAAFQGQAALVEDVRSDGTLSGRSYVGNGDGTVASFGAEGLQDGAVVSTSVNQPLRIERTRFFQPGQSDEQRFTIATTATVQGMSFSTTSSVLDVMRHTTRETVATPAGSFEACKFEFNTEVVEQSTGARVVESGFRWISPTYGIVKVEKTATTTVPIAGTSTQAITWQLTRARHGGQSVP
jgi:hypothetical protein